MEIDNKKVFPYLPPNNAIKEKYRYIFELKNQLKSKKIKRIFDIFFSLFLLLLFSPLILITIFFYYLEMIFNPLSRGYIFYYYYSVSAGRKFKKYKIRTIKMKFDDQDMDKKNIWGAHKSEWNPNALTFTGKFIKKFYLDEIPQFFNILKGDISLIGPRALSEEHYKKDYRQGNTYRQIIKAGLIGLGHANKGTIEMGNPKYEYQYLDAYINSSLFNFYYLEIKIIIKSIFLIIKGGGH